MGKRFFDIVVAASALLLCAPLMLALAAAIRLESPGPSLFRQVRIGRYGRPFPILKFRTMLHDIDARDAGLAIGDDPRITRIGQVLRKYKLNELPQFINVLRGEMSIVGPRPELPRYVDLYTPRDRETILAVRPGITDPASLRYRNEGEILSAEPDPHRAYVERIMPHKLAIARRYLRRRSVLSDARVLVQTVVAVLRPSAVPAARANRRPLSTASQEASL